MDRVPFKWVVGFISISAIANISHSTQLSLARQPWTGTSNVPTAAPNPLPGRRRRADVRAARGRLSPARRDEGRPGVPPVPRAEELGARSPPGSPHRRVGRFLPVLTGLAP